MQQQQPGWDFPPLAPLQTWKIAVGLLLFVCFIFGIVLRLRRKPENAESFRLYPGRGRSDSPRR
jgi:type VI protein secretion system component VasK